MTADAPRSGRPGPWREIVLVAVLVVLAARLGVFVVDFGKSSLQMDFSSFYAAGESASRGLSPYVNHVDADPPIWDGVDRYRHSRFLYPPLAARAFQPLTGMAYFGAKFFWMLFSLAALGAALAIAARIVRLGRAGLLVTGIVAVAFFPVLALLERGQIDSVTLALIIGAVALLPTKRTALWAGVTLAIATWVKLHCVFFLPFLLVRRRWHAVAGFAATGAALLLVSLLLDGPRSIADYALRELPRISRYGEGGTRSMQLPSEGFRPLMEGVTPGMTVRDGREYAPEKLEFVLNASLVRTPLGRSVWRALRGLGWNVAPAHVSLVFLAVGFGVVLVWQRWNGDPRDDAGELVYWQTILVLILLCAPVTWAMSVVWLLPIAVIVLHEAAARTGRLQVASTALCAAGLLFAAAPDGLTGVLLAPFGAGAGNAKYLVAEVACLLGLLGLWRGRSIGLVDRVG